MARKPLWLAMSVLMVWNVVGCRRRAPEASPLIAAAADLRFALEEIEGQYAKDTGHRVRLSFGSSGNIARQIEQGAPYEIFFSADEGLVAHLQQVGRTEGAGVVYGVGRIGWFVPKGSPVEAGKGAGGIEAAMRLGRLRAFAIAHPDHAPYGMRAQEALRHAGLWDGLKPHLVYGENVAQAAQFTLSGEAQAGIIAYSLALAPPFRDQGHFELIPAEWHRPLIQRMTLLKGAGPEAHSFHAYLQEPAARAILRKYGFMLPGEGR